MRLYTIDTDIKSVQAVNIFHNNVTQSPCEMKAHGVQAELIRPQTLFFVSLQPALSSILLLVLPTTPYPPCCVLDQPPKHCYYFYCCEH